MYIQFITFSMLASNAWTCFLDFSISSWCWTQTPLHSYTARDKQSVPLFSPSFGSLWTPILVSPPPSRAIYKSIQSQFIVSASFDYRPEQKIDCEILICGTILLSALAMPSQGYWNVQRFVYQPGGWHNVATLIITPLLRHRKLTWRVLINPWHTAPPGLPCVFTHKVSLQCMWWTYTHSTHLSLKNSAISLIAFLPFRCFSSRMSNPVWSALSAWAGMWIQTVYLTCNCPPTPSQMLECCKNILQQPPCVIRQWIYTTLMDFPSLVPSLSLSARTIYVHKLFARSFSRSKVIRINCAHGDGGAWERG